MNDVDVIVPFATLGCSIQHCAITYTSFIVHGPFDSYIWEWDRLTSRRLQARRLSPRPCADGHSWPSRIAERRERVLRELVTSRLHSRPAPEQNASHENPVCDTPDRSTHSTG